MNQFLDVLKQYATSKKAIAFVAGLVMLFLNQFGLDLPEETITRGVALIASYLVGQGLADIGKEAEKQKQANQ